MRGSFQVTVDFSTWRRIRPPRGYLLLAVEPRDKKDAEAMLRAYERDCHKRVEKGERPRPIDIDWELPLAARSLSMNRLQWALLDLRCRMRNEGLPDGLERWDPMRLYNEDMGKVAPARQIVVEHGTLAFLEEAGVTVKAAVPVEGSDGKLWEAWVVKTSSHFNTAEFHLYTEFQFNELAAVGLPLPEDQLRVRTWWKDWMLEIDRKRVELHAEELDKAQYRLLHPMCEGCGAPLMHGGGEVHHIRSRGAGGATPERDKGRNWLHLCVECHRIWTAVGGGVEAFKKHAPHLVNRIDAALAAA